VATFTAETYQNEYLAEGASEVNAVVTVTAGGATGAGGSPGGAPEANEIIMLDCSGSMAQPMTKLRAAQTATATAIDCLRDGVWFAVIRGTGQADMVYPAQPGLVPANPETSARPSGPSASSPPAAARPSAPGWPWPAVCSRCARRPSTTPSC